MYIWGVSINHRHFDVNYWVPGAKRSLLGQVSFFQTVCVLGAYSKRYGSGWVQVKIIDPKNICMNALLLTVNARESSCFSARKNQLCPTLVPKLNVEASAQGSNVFTGEPSSGDGEPPNRIGGWESSIHRDCMMTIPHIHHET